MFNRAYNRIKALTGGYFWLPCPLCGRNFGGHETADTTLMIGFGIGESVCKNCGEEAARLTKLNKDVWCPPFIPSTNKRYV